ncbi:MAG: hypothetical protein V8S37_05680 [Lachnospiraceae bacterium]
MKIVSIAMITITTMIMNTHHDHSHESHHHSHEMAESAENNSSRFMIKGERDQTPTPMTTIMIADMIIPTIMVTPTTITPAWQVFPISSSI